LEASQVFREKSKPSVPLRMCEGGMSAWVDEASVKKIST
jgi:hypothetical protein